ncbi:hypothetical protein B0T26DRAFT_472686 [Lasiosphaeria miniovina]|uniref:Dicer-like protein 2 n=1 Tax=Lasiosphaeria miniovina TaxID=1954250 RepID=A0AA40A009_9PEZI|nr:uncharacterized protein B0T26DRAFT_472686 [Lasiosphaeria miniovina]KAK0706786.1 hypothetical protein B0T26DRAFT_472686 [Lasiosphaeria miniovina]
MDTGSGKTRVAVLRIMVELERSEKRVWFLTPTVPLALQQFEVLQAEIPAVQCRLICGLDNVEAWSEQRVWDAVLYNVRVVVSTFKILFDAVSHAFVRLSSLSLIVIDEAHNCIKKNPVARLMNEFYWPAKQIGHEVPHILGLTASPLVTSKAEELEVLETTLDAICRRPNKHRDELIAQVNRPDMIATPYGSLLDVAAYGGPTSSMSSLKKAYLELDIKKDPYIVPLLATNTLQSRAKLREALIKRNTYAQRQMKAFCARAWEMCVHLGPWAADYYIHRTISGFLTGSGTSDKPLEGWTDEEKKYLATAFRSVDAPQSSEEPTRLSAKVDALLDILDSHSGSPVGIVFVKERATAAVLSHILSVHPRTKDRYRVGSMVGTSNSPGQKQDFLDPSQKDYSLSLQRFRKGKTNLLVATSVIEEGIDIPACNLVICFDKPENLKAFIQRRGRARMSTSQLYLMLQDTTDQSATEWQRLEEEMKRMYEDEMRQKKMLEELESSEIPEYPVLEDEVTGARLTIDDAKQHLEHFCATISTREFVNWSPFYVVHSLDGSPIDNSRPSLLKATVHLPVSLAPEVRRAESLRAWNSEANACKDAAFQAYVNLYRASLVNHNLLPLTHSKLLKGAEARLGLAIVKAQMNPWPEVANAWRNNGELFKRRLTVSSLESSARVEFEMALPIPIPHVPDFTLHWDYRSSWLISMVPGGVASSPAVGGGRAGQSTALLEMAFGHRWLVENKQYPIQLVSLERDLSVEDVGAKDFDVGLAENLLATNLLRGRHRPFFFLGHLPAKPPAALVKRLQTDFDSLPEDVPYVVVKDWPKKAGLFHLNNNPVLHPNPNPQPPSTKPYHQVLPADRVKVDDVPAVYSQVGMMIPAITHALEVYLVAADLLESRLEKTGITDLSLVATAITASASRGLGDYERIEFLGDSILKLCATIDCTAENLHFPEGYLSLLKEKIVSNSRLFRAATQFGLDKYIILKCFTHQKWRPTYVEDLLEQPPSITGTRKISTKTVADVVEALIGASFISGGISKALACMSLFLPERKWQSIEAGREALYKNAPANDPLPITIQPVEQLIGYTFSKKSLLTEALTHPSYKPPVLQRQDLSGAIISLDRAEFLGDAILDHIVVTKIFAVNDPRPLTQSEMHLLRTALVNADILAFLAMEWSITQNRFDITAGPGPSGSEAEGGSEPPLSLMPFTVELPLWSFMRHGSSEIALIQRATKQRYAELRGDIRAAMRTGSHYPWALLARLQAQKFFSNMFEAVLGAVWVDSGSLAECEKLVERAGILPYLRRMLADKVHVLHPKEELGHLAISEKVDYVIATSPSPSPSDSGDVVFSCRVLVGGRCVADVAGGMSREEVRVRAAEEACRFLKSRGAAAGGV